MENLFTDAQVPQHPLIKRGQIYRLLSALLILQVAVLNGQQLSTTNKRSAKLYYKAEEALVDRDFDKAKLLLKQSASIDPNFGESYLKLASIYKLYQNDDSSKHYLVRYTQVTPSEKVSWKIWRNLAYLHFEDGEYHLAQFAMGELLNDKPEHINAPELRLLMESIDFSIKAIAKPSVIVIDTLPKAINQYQLQYFPVLTVDGRTMIYTKRNSIQLTSDEDIVISSKTESGWMPSVPISKRINTDLNEGGCSVSADGRTLIFASCDEGRTFGNCDLFVSRKVGDQWSKPENMGTNINSKYWDSQPSLSSDGHTLYFSSNRPGGFGKCDLWKSRLINGTWSKPTNLGDKINGFKDEVSPFIYASNDELFFLSNGKVGLGGFDLYYTSKENSEWTTPKNLGAPINSHNNEGPIFIASNGIDAYYSKEFFENKVVNGQLFNLMVESQIMHFQFPNDSIKLRKSSYITGLVTNADNQSPIGASFLLMNLNDSTDIYYANSDPVTGQYFLTVNEGKEYGVFIEKSGFLFDNFSFEANENTIDHPDTVNIHLQPITIGREIILQNVYFDFDDYTLSEKSIYELKRVADFMKQNLQIKFIIEGHTDNIGESSYNLQLSARRAESVKVFLLNQGIKEDRLESKGLGSSNLIDASGTESAHKTNRRIVFKVAE